MLNAFWKDKLKMLLMLSVLAIVYFTVHITAKQQELLFEKDLLQPLWQWGHALSQDETHYLTQAKKALEKQGPTWADTEAFYRPPLASFYFQYLYITTNFNQLAIAILQSILAFIAYVMLFIRTRDYFGLPVALAAFALATIHPVLIFFNTSGEDSVLALFFISTALFLVADKRQPWDGAKALFVGIIFGFAIISRANVILIIGLFIVAVVLWLPQLVKKSEPLSAPIIRRTAFLIQMAIGLSLAALANRLPHFTNLQWHPDTLLVFGATDHFGHEIAVVAFLLFIAGTALLFLFNSSKPLTQSTAGYAMICFMAACFLYLWIIFPVLLVIFFKAEQFQKELPDPSDSVNPLARQSVIKSTAIPIPSHFTLFNHPDYAPLLVLLMTPSIVIVLLCAWHNYRELDYFSVTVSMAGEALAYGNHPIEDYRITMQGYSSEWWVNYASPFREFHLAFAERFPEITGDNAKKKATIQFMIDYPGEALRGFLIKLHRAFANYEIPRNRNFSVIRESSAILSLPYLPFSVVVALTLIAFVRLFPQQGAYHYLFIVLMLIAPLSLLAIETVFLNASRYRSVGLPFLIPFAVLGTVQIARTIYQMDIKKSAIYVALISIFFLFGATAVDQKTQDKYRSIELYKLARMQLITDGEQHPPGIFMIADTDLFQKRLEDALRLFPQNIEAFYLQQLYRIYALKQREIAVNATQAYRNGCSERDFVCHRTTGNLLEIARDPEAFIKKLGWDSAHNERYFTEYHNRHSKPFKSEVTE